MPLNKNKLQDLPSLEQQQEQIKTLVEYIPFKLFLAWLENMEAVHSRQLRNSEEPERINGRLDTYEEIFNYINEKIK